MLRRRLPADLTLIVLVLAVTCLMSSCRGRREASPEPTVDPGYVPTSVASALAAAATHRATLGSPTATPTAMPPTATALPPTATATPTAPAVVAKLSSQPQGVVRIDGLRLRKGPGTMYVALGALYADDVIEVAGRNEAADWLQVVVTDGRSGWVSAEYVDLDMPVASVPVAPDVPPTPQPAATAVTQP